MITSTGILQENFMAGRHIQILILIILILFPAIGLTQEKMVVRFESPVPDPWSTRTGIRWC